MRTMRLREILREAARDLTAGVGGGPWLTLVVVFAMALSVSVPQLALRDANERALAYRESGAATLIVQAPGQIDGARCEAFRDLPNVVGAGAVSEIADGVTLTVLPRTTVRYFVSSPRFAELLGADRAGSGVLLSQEVADGLGWRTDRAVLIDDEPSPVAGTYLYPDDGRRAGLGFAIIGERPAVGELFDECWLTVWPQTDDVRSLAQLVVVPRAGADSGGPGPTLLRLNSTLGTTFSVGASRDVWIYGSMAGMFLAALAALVFVRMRRLEFASARHIGVRPSDQAAVVLTETTILGILAMTIASPVVLYLIMTADPEAVASLVWWGLRGVCAVGAGVIIGTVLGILTVREHHFFRYFRER